MGSLRFWLDRLRRRLERWRPGNLTARALPAGTLEVVDGAWRSTGPDPQLILPPGRYAPGFYLLVVHVRGPSRRGSAKLYVDFGDGFSEAHSFGLVTKYERSVFRVVHLPREALRLRLDPSEEEGPVELPVLRFHRIPTWFARLRMRSRLGLEHATFAGQSTQAVDTAIRVLVAERSVSADQAAFVLYHQTFAPSSRSADYATWITSVEAPENDALAPWPPGARGPLISVLVPTYRTESTFLRACLDSVLTQSYPHVELCIADDASPDRRVRELLADYAGRDARVRVHLRQTNGHICLASNDALGLATGDYVALLDHDDVLAEHALLRVARALEAQPGAKLLYSDEDKLSPAGLRREPHFKGAFDPDRLLSQAYLGHLVVARTDEVRALGGFRPGYEGSQDHDLTLRLSERCAPGEIVHVPHVLYHWRESEGSTAMHSDAKSYTAEAGRAAVEDAVRRRGLLATVEHAPHLPHGYRVRFALPSPPPLVSLIVPTRDHAALLRVCLGSILELTTYPHFEVIVVDNGSVEPETFEYFADVTRDPRVRVLRVDAPFNFSALNNAAAREARGEVLALVNNDIEALDGSWLEEMVSHALRPDVGCVGAKLLYPDGRIQHAGVITGLGGVAGHAHKYAPGTDSGYFGRLRLVHTCSAVTAACLVVRREIYEAVGGLDETLAVAFNDVDFCLEVRAAGYRNVLSPYAVLRHHESASRGAETTPEKQARFAKEAHLMKERWGFTLRRDPYYSPRLSLEREDFGVAVRPMSWTDDERLAADSRFSGRSDGGRSRPRVGIRSDRSRCASRRAGFRRRRASLRRAL